MFYHTFWPTFVICSVICGLGLSADPPCCSVHHYGSTTANYTATGFDPIYSWSWLTKSFAQPRKNLSETSITMPWHFWGVDLYQTREVTRSTWWHGALSQRGLYVAYHCLNSSILIPAQIMLTFAGWICMELETRSVQRVERHSEPWKLHGYWAIYWQWQSWRRLRRSGWIYWCVKQDCSNREGWTWSALARGIGWPD